jgi:hypothetical protein
MIIFTRAMVSGLPRCFGAVIWFACGMPVCAADAPVVIQHGTVFDSVAGKLLAERTILIERMKIKSVGAPHTPLPVPDGARVIDAKGKFIVPGLIDAHVHLVHRLNFAHVTGDEVLPAFLAAPGGTVGRRVPQPSLKKSFCALSVKIDDVISIARNSSSRA